MRGAEEGVPEVRGYGCAEEDEEGGDEGGGEEEGEEGGVDCWLLRDMVGVMESGGE